jgi:hypothetical protein
MRAETLSPRGREHLVSNDKMSLRGNARGETAKFLPACKAVSFVAAYAYKRSAARGGRQRSSQINDYRVDYICVQNSAYRHQKTTAPSGAVVRSCYADKYYEV